MNVTTVFIGHSSYMIQTNVDIYHPVLLSQQCKFR